MKNNIIYITGFMGSGKSTIGPILANSLGWNFMDIDEIIEKELGKKIKDIFKEEGEQYFRKIETELISKISKLDEVVVSLGGGTIASNDNLRKLQESGKIIYLKNSPEEIYERLKYKLDRPLFQTDDNIPLNKEEAMKRIRDLLNYREQFYNQADIILDMQKLSLGNAVDYLIKLIEKTK